MELLCKLIIDGKSPWYAASLLYGVGGIDNPFEKHRYGWTRSMMIEMLSILGFEDFEFFTSDFDDSSNGWIQTDFDKKFSASMNIKCVKKNDPFMNPAIIYEQLLKDNMSGMVEVISKLSRNEEFNKKLAATNEYYIQSLAFQIIDMKHRISYLEENEAKQNNTITEKDNRIQELENKLKYIEEDQKEDKITEPNRLSRWFHTKTK
jgi:uncharacterized coiled-coil protein SlyX